MRTILSIRYGAADDIEDIDVTTDTPSVAALNSPSRAASQEPSSASLLRIVVPVASKIIIAWVIASVIVVIVAETFGISVSDPPLVFVDSLCDLI